MSRYGKYTEGDTAPLSALDTAFSGVNAKLSPDLLQPGLVREAVNVRFRRGRAETREGCMELYHAPEGVARFQTSGIFSDPDGAEWLLLSCDDGRVLQWRQGHSPRVIAAAENSHDSPALALVQAFGSVLAFHGSENLPWQWSGRNRDSFLEMEQYENVDDTSPIPNGSDLPGLRPVLMNNRIFVPYSRDRIAASQILAFTRYDALMDDFNVNDGSDDSLTALYPFSNNTLLVFKDQSTYAIGNVYGNLSEVRLDQINREVGCIAGRTVASVGGDVFWLGAGGVYRLQQVVQERLQTAPVPVSDPIAPIIDRINGATVASACAAVMGEYYYLAVPLDGASRNNTVLAFNSVTGAWEGEHRFPCAIDALHVTDYHGRKGLYAVDYEAGRVVLLYIGRSDILGIGVGKVETEIPFRLETRGYGLGENGVKQFRRVQLSLSTWRPSYSVALAGDGVNETADLTSQRTRSRTRLTVHARAPYNLTNAGNNHAQAYREDYAWILEDNAALKPAGIVPGRQQDCTERFQSRTLGRSASVIVTNDQGTLSLGSVQLDGEESHRRQATLV